MAFRCKENTSWGRNELIDLIQHRKYTDSLSSPPPHTQTPGWCICTLCTTGPAAATQRALFVVRLSGVIRYRDISKDTVGTPPKLPGEQYKLRTIAREKRGFIHGYTPDIRPGANPSNVASKLINAVTCSERSY